MKQLKRQLLALALGFVLAMTCLPGTALAYDRIPELERLCTLTVSSPHVGVTYEAYKVCDVDALVRFTPCGAFAECSGIELLIEAGEWEDLTTTLMDFLAGREADGRRVEPQATQVTTLNESGTMGTAVFEGLPVGLYLIRGREYLTDAGYFIPVNFMICLPNWVEAGKPGNETGTEDTWVYDVTAINKGSVPDREWTARNVVKAWRGDGSIDRPTSVTVQLLRTDRETGQTIVYDEVTLNSRNGWDNLWPDLDNVHYTWRVREIDVPADYEVIYRQDGINVTIINNYDPDGPKNDPDPPPPSDDPPPENPPDYPPGDPPDGPPNIPNEDIEDPEPPLGNWPEEPDLPEEPIDDDEPPLARLPQTGVLWWPVPILAMSGMFLFVLGWVLNRRKYEE